MNHSTVDGFVSRARSVLESSLPADVETTTIWLVDPLLAILGWSDEYEHVTSASLEETPVDRGYALDGTPAMFVAVEPATEELSADRIRAIDAWIEQTCIGKGIYTNGRTFTLIDSCRGENRQIPLSMIPQTTDTLERFTTVAVSTEFETSTKAVAAARIESDRPAIDEEITAILVATAGSDHADAFRLASERFLDRLTAVLRGSDESGDHVDNGSVDDGERTDSVLSLDGSSNEDTAAETDTNTARSAESKADRTGKQIDEQLLEVDSNDRIHREEPESGESSEYVATFFAERGKVGAIGHSDSAAALTGAVEFLLTRGLSTVQLPWRPSDGEPIVLDRHHPAEENTTMLEPVQLSNEYVLETHGDVSERARRVEALASRAGLRVMLSGDWTDSRTDQ